MTDVTLCPFCEDEGVTSHGTADPRVRLNGRLVYRCERNPREHGWQDLEETPSHKGTPISVVIPSARPPR